MSSVPLEASVRESERLLRKRRLLLWAPVWICAVFLLFANLGVIPISGSEARWTQITREMFASCDFFHPTINGEPYYDKPLLTYWFIALVKLVTGGDVTELTARIPSAFCALGFLAAVISIAGRLFGTRAAVISAWLTVSSYSFAFWGRLAEADMANLMFSTAAVAWFLAYREERSFFGYSVFFAICAVGSHAKGMGAAAVPVLAVLADLILFKRWKFHLLNWEMPVAAVIGIFIYLLPFLISKCLPAAVAPESQDLIDFDGTMKTSGIALALRENVVRFFAPFDHTEHWWSYFIHLPRHLLPWTPLFAVALLSALKDWRKRSANMKWLLLTALFLFLFFTLSGSKRHYYILPLIPYCFILTGAYLSRSGRGEGILDLLEHVFLFLHRLLPVVFAGLVTLASGLLALKPEFMPGAYRELSGIVTQTFISALGLFAIQMVLLLKICRIDNYAGPETPRREVLSALFLTFSLMMFLFVYALPASSMLRTERAAVQTMRRMLDMNGADGKSVYFFNKDFNNTVYYLDMPFRIPLLKTPEELEKLIEENPRGGIYVISQRRYFTELPQKLLTTRLPAVVREHVQPWERSRSSRRDPLEKKMEMRLLIPELEKK